MQNKKGVSLTMLVITIIVMTVLAGAIAASLENNNPIDKANFSRVCKTVYTVRTAVSKYAVNLAKDNKDVPGEMKAALLTTPTVLYPDYYTGYQKLNINKDVLKKELKLDAKLIIDIQNLEDFDITKFGTFYVHPNTGECIFELTEDATKKYGDEILPDNMLWPNTLEFSN